MDRRLGPRPHVERVQDLRGTLECDGGIYGSLIARGMRLVHTQQVEGFERIDDALDLNVPKTCPFEPRMMFVESL